jgi:uncharacterized secreted protein with C-terminal beta-propeller domain
MGQRAFMVTFRTVDPFFVIDLSDPADPHILGKLKFLATAITCTPTMTITS